PVLCRGAPHAHSLKPAGSDGAAAQFSISASDDHDANPTVGCVPPSGSTFPLGDTTVVCTATDSAHLATSGSFVVHVVDTTPPLLQTPSQLTVDATTSAGAG